MSTLYLRPGSADYNIQPSSAVGQGWLIICQWDMYRWGRAAVQAARANGAEIINYCLPTSDYGRNASGWNTSAGWSYGNWGFSQQMQFYSTNRTTCAANGWYWDKTSPWRATIPNYWAWLMDVRGSVPGGTPWMRHVVANILSWKNDPNWQLDGVMLDVSGDTYTAGATAGLSAAEKADLHAGHRLLHQMIRNAVGPNFIIQANDYVSATNPWINGMLLENHRAYDGPGSGMDLSMQRCTHPKRRHMAFVATGAQANTFLNTLCTHVTLGTDTANVSPIPGSSVATGAWPADALHIQGYNSVTDTGGEPPPSLTPPVNVTAPIITGTATVGNLLSSSAGTWSGNPTPTITGYAWYRNGSAISGATQSAYTLVAADAGTSVYCRVTASNSEGSASANSNALNVGGGGGTDITPPLAPTAISVVTVSGQDYLEITLPADTDRVLSGGLKVYRKPSAWSANEASGSATLVTTYAQIPQTVFTTDLPLSAFHLPAGTYYFKSFTYDATGNEQTGGPSTSYTVSGAAPWRYSAGFTPVQMTEGGGEPGTAPPWLYSGGFVAQQVPEEEGGGNGGNGGGNGGNGGGNGGEPVIPPVASNARLLVGSAGVPAHPTRDDAV